MKKQEQQDILAALAAMQIPTLPGAAGFKGIPDAYDGGINAGIARAMEYISKVETREPAVFEFKEGSTPETTLLEVLPGDIVPASSEPPADEAGVTDIEATTAQAENDAAEGEDAALDAVLQDAETGDDQEQI